MSNETALLDNQDIKREFLDQLSARELKMLRAIVKKIHMHHYPETLFTNDMADLLISKFGHEYGEKIIKKAVDEGLFN